MYCDIFAGYSYMFDGEFDPIKTCKSSDKSSVSDRVMLQRKYENCTPRRSNSVWEF